MLPEAFVQLVTEGEPGLEPLLLSLGAELGRAVGDDSTQALRSDRAFVQMERLTCALGGVDSLPSSMQLQLISSLVLARFSVSPEPRRGDFGDLRPDVVLTESAGHPIVVGAVVAAIAQRAGLPVGLVIGDHHVLIAHRGSSTPEAISVDRSGEVVDARELGDRHLAWRCAHQISAVVLDLVAERGEALGLRGVAVRACELATALPLDDHTLAHRDLELRRAQSAWN